ncbi:hypothetical protein [Collinsella ihumii]|uniref:hypothetical protein n=1 Tax=Collinsella ihumii TaxID=1720204 RepID=UPI001EF3D9AA|nr:hypothetical protein [Collinsella ihumii]MDN0055779.1 hypothetical protein [Collinsella ihumii]
MCHEQGSLLLNDKTQVVCGEQACTDWPAGYLARTGFMSAAQATVVRAFGMGTDARALWVDTGAGEVRVWHYDARMVVPLTWDEDGVPECAFVTRAFWRGRAVDQLQTHLRGGGIGEAAVGTAADGAGALPVGTGKGGYRIVTVCFDEQGNVVKPIGVCPGYETGSE